MTATTKAFGEVRVDPLEWKYRAFDAHEVWGADDYDIWVGSDYHRLEGVGDDVRLYPTLEAAQAAAQADYEARILSALEPAVHVWHRMYDAAVMAHPKVVALVDLGNQMAASIEGNYYLPRVATRWRAALTPAPEGGEG